MLGADRTRTRQPHVSNVTNGKRAASSPRRRRDATSSFPPLRGLWLLIVVLVLWQLLQRGQSAYFPKPSNWFTAIGQLWNSGQLSAATLETCKTFALGLVFATIIGSAAGVLVGRSRLADRLVGPVLEYIRVLPAPAIVPLAVLYGGYSQLMAVSVVVVSSLWPILLQVRSSARQIPPEMVDVAHAMHLGFRARLFKIILPAVTSGIFLGVRAAAPLVLISTLLAELLTNIPGLGRLIGDAQSNFEAAEVFGLVVILGILGLIVNIAVSLGEAQLRDRQWR